MKFSEAVKKLEMGFEIKRESWEDKCIGTVEILGEFIPRAIKIEGSITSEFTITGYDIVAQDWGIMKNGEWQY